MAGIEPNPGPTTVDDNMPDALPQSQGPSRAANARRWRKKRATRSLAEREAAKAKHAARMRKRRATEAHRKRVTRRLASEVRCPAAFGCRGMCADANVAHRLSKPNK